MTTLFNVTKTASIEITNEQIVELQGASRATVMASLSVKESWARKVYEALKSGSLSPVAIVEASVASTTLAPSGKDVKRKPSGQAMELWMSGVTTQEGFEKAYDAMNKKASTAYKMFRRATLWFVAS